MHCESFGSLHLGKVYSAKVYIISSMKCNLLILSYLNHQRRWIFIFYVGALSLLYSEPATIMMLQTCVGWFLHICSRCIAWAPKVGSCHSKCRSSQSHAMPLASSTRRCLQWIMWVSNFRFLIREACSGSAHEHSWWISTWDARPMLFGLGLAG